MGHSLGTSFGGIFGIYIDRDGGRRLLLKRCIYSQKVSGNVKIQFSWGDKIVAKIVT
jgi:hypothetical protein